MSARARKFALGLVCVAALAGLSQTDLGTKANAAPEPSYGRQYYGSWSYQTTYYVRPYYYQPYSGYSGYNQHYVYYYPQVNPSYYYYYNPGTQTYWGRTPVKGDPSKPVYSMLKPEDRKKDLKDIPESAFPEPSTPPAIPESKDNVKMEMPPKDLPPVKAEKK